MNGKKVNEIYKCGDCGDIVELLRIGGGEIVCCDKPIEILQEKTSEEGKEKHVPVIEKTENGFKVKIGSIPHPMETGHHIEWIEIIVDGRVYRKFLKAGDAPEAEFCIKAEKITAREHCNLHGLWKAEA